MLPLTVGVPFPRGRLKSPDQVEVWLGEVQLPTQRAATGNWPDGSVRWLLLDFQGDYDGTAEQMIEVRWGDGRRAADAQTGIRLERTDEGIAFDNGRLGGLIGRDGDLLSLALDGEQLLGPAEWKGFQVVGSDGAAFRSGADATAELTIATEGPLRSVIRARGKHGNETGSLLDYDIRWTIRAGQPYLELDYSFTNCEETERETLKAISCTMRFKQADAVCGSANQPIGKAPQAEMSFMDERRIGEGSPESLVMAAHCWVARQTAEGGLAVSVRHAIQNAPKRLVAAPDELRIDLLPPDAEPLVLEQGMAKTHHLFLLACGPDQAGEIDREVYLFEQPPRPALDPEWVNECEVFDRVFPPRPFRATLSPDCVGANGREYPRIESMLQDLMDQRPRGLGMLHFGDEPNFEYTAQRRGGDDIVWNNNEYDTGRALFVQWARTGEQRFFDSAVAAVEHWMDVDVIHHSANPMVRGGLAAHSAYHTRGRLVTPSHVWVESFFDLYHLTGNERAKEIGLGVGENMLVHMGRPGFFEPGQPARNLGWTLYNIMALHFETGDERAMEAARRIVDSLDHWQKQDGAWRSFYVGRPHWRGIEVFMSAVALNGLKRYHQATGEERARRIFLSEVDTLLREGRNELGLFYYKQHIPVRWLTFANTIALEGLAYAHRLTGDARYIREGMRTLEYGLANFNFRLFTPTGASPFVRVPGGSYTVPEAEVIGGQGIGLIFRPLLPFLEAADELDLLKPLDFRY
jgi:hypothetical protein